MNLKLRRQKRRKLDIELVDRSSRRKTKTYSASGLAEGPRGAKGGGGGSWDVLAVPSTFRATSLQVCGLWPFASGSSRPMLGTPVGRDLVTGATVCCDAITWFENGLISSPSMLVLGLQGLGKSSFTVRQIIGCADRGVIPIALGDMKGEYGAVTGALGGTVLSVGRGEQMNVLDPGAMGEAADKIGGEGGAILREQALQRASQMAAALIQIVRHSRLEDWESTILNKAVRQLTDDRRAAKADPPTIADLADMLQDPPESLVRAALAGSADEFRSTTKPLARSLVALLDGPLGRTFAGQTTHRLPLDAPAVCVDVSAIRRQSDEVKAAVMLATWSEGYGAVEAANALAEVGLAPQRHYLMVMDEMWEPLRIEGAGLVDQLDALTRLNRQDGVANIFITHSLKDMESMASEADARKARGFAERSSIVVCAGLAMEDLRALSEVKRMSDVEMDKVSSWTTPDGWRPRRIVDPATGMSRPAPPPGAGKVLIKIGERAGIQTQVTLTPQELRLHDTNLRWVRNEGLAGEPS